MREDHIIDGDARRDRDEQGYRDLIATILHMANEDCATGGTENAVDAYRWVADNSPVMRRYCELLGIDPDVFRDSFVSQHGTRCERLIVKKIDYEEHVRDEEDARADLAGRKAVASAERDMLIRHNKQYANAKPANRPPKPVLTDEERMSIYREAASKELHDLWRKREERVLRYQRAEG